MAVIHEETERTYDVTPDTELPDLSGLRSITVATSGVIELEATYFDTGDLALASDGISLRRRTGGADQGWHLKLPADGDTRIEVRRALGRGKRVPVALTRMLTAVTTGGPLSSQVRVSTTRTSRDLVGDDGVVVATVSDDVVTATVPGGAPRLWREVEVELFDKNHPVLDELDRVFEAAGILRSPWASKLQRALDRVEPTPHRPASKPALPEQSSGAALHSYLLEQRRVLGRADLAVRALGASVHDVRVAARRIRTALTVYRRLIDEETARHLQAELQWIGWALSDVRDLEVAVEALESAVRDEPNHLKAGEVLRLVRRRLATARRPAMAAAVTALESERYLTLLRDLDAFLTTPALADGACSRAVETMPQLLTRPLRRLRRAVKTASAAGHEERLSALHDVRKSAKRLRYSLEVAAATLGAPADRLADAARIVQSILGDHLDSVATSGWLLRLGRDPEVGRAAFTFGRLHARNEGRIPQQLANYERAVRKLLKGRRTRFLRSPEGRHTSGTSSPT